MPIAAVFGSIHSDAKVHLRASIQRLGGRGEPIPASFADVFCVAVDGAASLGQTAAAAVAFDGMLFNPADLQRKLGLEQAEEAVSNAELVASAYERFGEGFAEELDGEFAFLLFDKRSRRLVAGMDATGRGALHYARHGSDIVFATEPVGLFAWPGLPALPDDMQIAAVMTLRSQPGRTYFRGVSSLLPGHTLAVEGGKPERLVRYWNPEQQPQLQLRNQAEYAERLLAAMERAVTLRLPREGLVGAELSSGYDSSAVTALTATALARQNRPLVAFTSVPAHHGVDAGSIVRQGIPDEWPAASRVAAMHPNIEHVRVSTAAAPWQSAIDGMAQVLGGPPLFIRNMPWMYAERRMAQAMGLTTVLNGQNGNLAGSYDGGFALFDMRRRGRWKQLVTTSLEWHRHGAQWKNLFLRAWMPTPATRLRLRRLRGRQADAFEDYSLLRPDFIRSTGMAVPGFSALGLPMEGDRRNGASRRLSIMQLVDFGAQYAAERRLFGVSRTDPTADRRLMEFCLSVPDEVFCPNGARRGLYREAMRNVLPPEILKTPDFGLQASDFLENFGAAMPAWRDELADFERSSLVGQYLDLQRMRTLLDSFAQRVAQDRGKADSLFNYTYGGAAALGRFLRQIERGGMGTGTA